MATPSPLFDQVNLVVRDMGATLAFYRRLGLTIADALEWPSGTGARHAEATMPNGVRLEFDNHEMVRIWHPAWRESPSVSSVVLNFSFRSRGAVDVRYAELIAAGYTGRRPPHDAFWGARYAILQDPDGRDVGLMSPPVPGKRFTPTLPA